jgi:hypothetical protein
VIVLKGLCVCVIVMCCGEVRQLREDACDILCGTEGSESVAQEHTRL